LSESKHHDLGNIGSILKAFYSGAALSLVVKVVGAALAFILQVLLARFMTEAEYGLYTYVVAWVMVAVVFSPIGINRAAVKFIPEYIANQRFAMVRNFVRWSYWTTLGTSLVCGLVFGFLTYAFLEKNDLATSLTYFLACLLIPINTIAQVGMEVIRSFKRVVLSDFSGLILRPLLFAICLAIAYFGFGKPMTAFTVIAINIAIGFLIMSLICYSVNSIVKSLPKGNDERELSMPRLWLHGSLPFLIIAGGNVILAKTDLIMIGSIIGAADAGLYNAAARIAALVGFPLLAINMVLAPIISQLYSGKRDSDFKSIVSRAAWLSFLATTILSALIYYFSESLLSLFGPSFVLQKSSLEILLLGQIIGGFAGPAGYVLGMAGQQRVLALIVCLTAILNIILNFFLVPIYGTSGAAIATVTTIAISNLLAVWASIRHVSVNPTIVSIRL
jgi:O-antigen/teichoic acid export membrane protein